MNEQKLDERIAQLGKFARNAAQDGANEGEIFSVLADCRNALNRVRGRAKVAGEWQRQEVRPNKGAALEFTGRLLAQDQWETKGHDPMRVEFELWETRGGAMVAVSASEPVAREGVEVVRAAVIERQDDAMAMRLAVMEFYEFHDRARNMAKKLGWALKVEVE